MKELLSVLQQMMRKQLKMIDCEWFSGQQNVFYMFHIAIGEAELQCEIIQFSLEKNLRKSI